MGNPHDHNIPRNDPHRNTRIDWSHVLDVARQIVGVSTIGPPTLRQLHYRLVARGLIPNTEAAYKRLSCLTAKGRRDGTFPPLVDRTREIDQPLVFNDPEQARQWLRDRYRIDRLSNQPYQVILGVEKDSLAAQVSAWFDSYGFPIIVLRGYTSQSYADEITHLIASDPRPTIVIYAGDFDPTGLDIERDLLERVDGISEFLRIAVTAETIKRFNLIEQPGKRTDPRAKEFERRHGRLVQVEVEALDPAELRALFQAEIDKWLDEEAFQRALEREEQGWNDLSRDPGDEDTE